MWDLNVCLCECQGGHEHKWGERLSAKLVGRVGRAVARAFVGGVGRGRNTTRQQGTSLAGHACAASSVGSLAPPCFRCVLP